MLTSSQSTGNQWYFDGTLVEGATENTITITEIGVYTVRTSVDDCVSETSDEFDAIILGVEENGAGQIQVLPNPVTDELVVLVEGSGAEVFNIIVIDAMGRRVFSETARGTDPQRFNMRNLSQGSYYVVVQTAGRTYSPRVVKR
jgi:hypothetical protein